MKNGRSLGWAGTQLLRWLPPPSSSHRPRAISTSGTQAVIWNPTSKLASHRPMVSGASKHASTVPDGRPLYPLSPAPTPAPAPAPAPAQAVPTASPTPSTRPASSVVSQDLKNLSQEIKRFAQLTKVSAQKPEALKDANKILDVALSDDQQELLDLMKSGQSVYFSGKAGTGKTLVLKKFIEYAQQNGLRVAVTAPTGIAATHLGGQTLHSFTSISPGMPNDPKVISQYIRQSPWRMNKYANTNILIMDESSMVDPMYFNLFQQVFSTLHNKRRGSRQRSDSHKPFSSLQIIITGDFFQLPPINQPFATAKDDRKLDELRTLMNKNTFAKTDKPIITYLFDSPAWKLMRVGQKDGLQVRYLTQVFRQSDMSFVAALDRLRMGTCDDETWKLLSQCSRPLTAVEDIQPTRICSMRFQASKYNQSCLDKIEGPEHVFSARDRLLRMPPDVNEEPIAISDNGSLSMSADIAPTPVSSELPPLPPLEEIARTLSSMYVDKHVRLKRGAQVILIKNLNVRKGLVNGSRGVITGFETMRDFETGETLELPVVRFQTCADMEFVVGYHAFEQKMDCDFTRVSRLQIPLKLGWALTVHKSQGMSLDAVEMELGGSFAPGQVYVALSRVRSLEGLCIRHLDRKSIWADQRVIQFYDNLREMLPGHLLR